MHKDLLELQELQVHKDVKVLKAFRAPRGQLVLKGLKEQPGFKDRLVLKVLQVLLDLLGYRERKAPLAHQVHKAHKGLRA